MCDSCLSRGDCTEVTSWENIFGISMFRVVHFLTVGGKFSDSERLYQKTNEP